MRAKLLALREGRIPADEEFISVLQDNTISTTAYPEEAIIPDQQEYHEDDDDDDSQVEGELVEDEKILNAHVDDLVMNLLQQSAEHLSTSSLKGTDVQLANLFKQKNPRCWMTIIVMIKINNITLIEM